MAALYTIIAILGWIAIPAALLFVLSRNHPHRDLTDDSVSDAGDVRQVEVLNFHPHGDRL